MGGVAERATPVSRAPVFGRDVAALAAGLVTGAFAAWAYSDETFRPLAHSFGLWIAMLALLSARQPARRSAVRAVVALAVAVVAFYVGKKVMYGIRYPGMPYAVNDTELAQWLVLALLTGALLGWGFSWVGRRGEPGRVAAAAAIGLLAADAYRRSGGYPEEAPVLVVVAVLAVACVLSLAVRSWRDLAVAGGLAVPCALAGYLVVSAPDLLQELLIVSRSG